MKTVLITGATGGIGKALVEKLSSEDVELILVSEDDCDLTNREQILSLTEKIKKEHNKIDVLFNVAGIGVYRPIEELSLAEWDKSLALNVTAPFILIKELMPLFGEGSVVINIGSGAGVTAMKDRAAYCSSKFALRGLSLTLAEEFKGKYPQFCLITLGSTLTSFGVGKALTLEEKIQKNKDGNAYFTPEWVAGKLVEIMNASNRLAEYVIYPNDYNHGEK